MENLMFWGMFVACLLISAMTFYIMYSQAMVNRDLERKYKDLNQEISRVFGWDEYDWANNFRDYARKVEGLIKFKKEIEKGFAGVPHRYLAEYGLPADFVYNKKDENSNYLKVFTIKVDK